MGKKSALFDVEEFNINGEVARVQDVQKVHEVHEVHEVQKEIGTTQGKKGQKLKRINMAFSDVNHEYVTKESRRRGISSTAFVNQIIDEYRNK
jgi:hypothetical protein